MENNVKLLTAHVAPYGATDGASYFINRGFSVKYLGVSDYGIEHEAGYYQEQEARKEFFKACKTMKLINTYVEGCYCYLCEDLRSCFTLIGEDYMTITVCPTPEDFKRLETHLRNFQNRF